MAKNQWPPTAVKAAVLERLPEAAKDAEWPSWKEIDQRCRMLGRRLLYHTNLRPPKEVYPMMAISSRGGLHVANIISRVFDYGNPDMRFIGLSSYVQSGTERADEFLRGHLPLQEDIYDQNVLMVDEVCDTGKSLVENARILKELGAASITSAVIDYKPERTKAHTGFVPDLFVRTTEKWIVYPWEVNEILGPDSLNERLWDPSQF